LPNTTPSKRPERSQGPADKMLCPSCNGDSFSERSSFKTTSEPLLGVASTNVIVDLMNCNRCGADIPAVRGKRRYTLVGKEKLAALVADLEEAQRANLEMRGLLDALARRAQTLNAEIEMCKAEGDISVMEAKVAALEQETDGMEERRAKLAKTLDLMASRIPSA
jgi:hypothetical protein